MNYEVELQGGKPLSNSTPDHIEYSGSFADLMQICTYADLYVEYIYPVNYVVLCPCMSLSVKLVNRRQLQVCKSHQGEENKTNKNGNPDSGHFY